MPEVVLEVSLDRGDLPLPTLAAEERLRAAQLTLVTPGTIALPLRVSRQPESGDINWVSGEWGQLRSIVSVALSPSSTKIASLRISAGGVWFTPVPPGSIEAGTFQPACRFSLQTKNPFRFPPIVATGVLLELVSEQKVTDKPSNWNPDTAPFSGLEVLALNELADLSVGLDDDAAFFSFKGRKNDTVTLDLLPHLAKKPGATRIRVRAAGPVRMLATLTVQTYRDAPPPSLPPASTLEAPVTGRGEAVARWTLPPPPGQILSVAGRVVRDPACERFALTPAEEPSLVLAQLLDRTHAAAQRIGPVEGTITGAELWLGTRLGTASGTLALHADEGGRPGALLASAPWTLAEGEARWVSVPLDREESGALWLVATGASGEAYCGLWSAGDPVALGRTGPGPWRVTRGQAWHRARVRAELPPTVKVVVSRDTFSVERHVAEAFELDPAAIAQLNQGSGELRVELRSEVISRVELQDLQVALG